MVRRLFVAIRRQRWFGPIALGRCRPIAISRQRQRGNAGPALFVRGQVGEDFLRGLRPFSQDQLQVMTQGGFHRRNISVRHANPVGHRTEHLFGLLQRGQGAGAETFVFGLQLFEHVETRAFLRLFLNHALQPLRQPLDFPLNCLHPLLTIFGGAAPGLSA